MTADSPLHTTIYRAIGLIRGCMVTSVVLSDRQPHDNVRCEAVEASEAGCQPKPTGSRMQRVMRLAVDRF